MRRVRSRPSAARSWSSRRAVRTYQSFLWSWSSGQLLVGLDRPGRPAAGLASP